MSNKERNSNVIVGFGLAEILFVVFLVMKLAGIGVVANWSWWWVTAPLWMPISIILGIILIALIVYSFLLYKK